jgi:hypothetical protein
MFWDCQCHDLTLWESLLLVWSLSIFCHKMCELVQLVASQFLAQSLKRLDLEPSLESQCFNNLHLQFSTCSLQAEMLYAFNVLVPPLPDFAVIEHILLRLPLTNPSMLWHLH